MLPVLPRSGRRLSRLRLHRHALSGCCFRAEAAALASPGRRRRKSLLEVFTWAATAWPGGPERSFPSAGTGPDPVLGRIRIRCRQSSPRDGNRCRGAVIRKLSGSWIHAPTADHRAPKGGPSCPACLLIAAAQRGWRPWFQWKAPLLLGRLVHAVTRDHASDQCCFPTPLVEGLRPSERSTRDPGRVRRAIDGLPNVSFALA